MVPENHIETEVLDPLAPLADEFTQLCRIDSSTTVEDFALRHPEQAERIRRLFPSLMLVEKLSPGSSSSGGKAQTEIKFAGSQVGDYNILGELGRGGMGIVYRAVHKSLGREVALKILSQPALHSHGSLERFQLEARSAARLHHPNIVPVFDVGQEGDTWFYTMQIIQGEGLDRVLEAMRLARTCSPFMPAELRLAERDTNRGDETQSVLPPTSEADSYESPGRVVDKSHRSTMRPREPSNTPRPCPSSTNRHYYRDVAEIVRQVAAALEFAHQQSILHRDIKPSNLLLDSTNHIWITDFGLAKTVEDCLPSTDGELTATGDIVGTIRYMAPERFRGWSDPRSDVYSLGATLYELLTLQPAFQEHDRIRLIERIRAESPPKPRSVDSRIPVDLETIVLKSMDKEPGRRYQSGGEMAADLANFLADRPIRARRETVSEGARRWCRRNPAIAALSLILAFVAIGAWIGTLWLWQRSETMRKKAQVNLVDANRNLDLAVAAVEQFGTRVADDLRLKQYDLRPLRSELLKTAIDFQQQLLELRADTEFAKLDLARAWQRLGVLTSEIDAPDRAATCYQNAIERFDEVIAESGPTNDIEFELAVCLNQFAHQAIESGQSDQAISALERSASLLQELLRDNPEWSAVHEELAKAWALHSNAMSWTRRFDQAVTFAQKAAEERLILNALYPETTQCVSELANARIRLAKSLLDSGISHWRESEKQLLDALEVQRQAVLRTDATSFERRVLGGVLRALAEICKITNRQDKANGYLNEARQIFEQLCRDEPTVLSHSIDLGTIWFEIACNASLAGDSAAETSAFEKSVGIMEPVVAKAPDNIVATTWLAHGYFRLGGKLVSSDPVHALDYFNRGVSILDDVLKQEPENRNAISFLPDLLAARARLLAQTGRLKDALVDCQRAIAISSVKDDRGSIQLNCALVMAIAGDYERATEQAKISMDEMAARCDPRFLAPMWKLAAKVVTKSGEMARADQRLEMEERKRQFDHHCEMAIEMLTQGIKSGLDVNDLSESADFAILRDDPQFKKLIGQ
jgi:serine/threonine protein kinase/tetratricopeptide (TPR) repeat protein